VTEYNSLYYRIVYEDRDYEDLTHSEVTKLLFVTNKEGEANIVEDISTTKIMNDMFKPKTKIMKEPYRGWVNRYDHPYYKVEYENGDEEDLTHIEVKSYLSVYKASIEDIKNMGENRTRERTDRRKRKRQQQQHQGEPDHFLDDGIIIQQQQQPQQKKAMNRKNANNNESKCELASVTNVTTKPTLAVVVSTGKTINAAHSNDNTTTTTTTAESVAGANRGRMKENTAASVAATSAGSINCMLPP
jgi:hypothetical protein